VKSRAEDLTRSKHRLCKSVTRLVNSTHIMYSFEIPLQIFLASGSRVAKLTQALASRGLLYCIAALALDFNR